MPSNVKLFFFPHIWKIIIIRLFAVWSIITWGMLSSGIKIFIMKRSCPMKRSCHLLEVGVTPQIIKIFMFSFGSNGPRRIFDNTLGFCTTCGASIESCFGKFLLFVGISLLKLFCSHFWVENKIRSCYTLNMYSAVWNHIFLIYMSTTRTKEPLTNHFIRTT